MKFLRHTKPSLLVDVGAAAGTVSQLMLSLSPASRVIAFEPFPGNFPFIEAVAAQHQQMTLKKAAVGKRTGTANFAVGGTVQGTEPGWERLVGYSSAGYLDRNDALSQARSKIEVHVVRLDDEIKEPVTFLKIDVEGGELDVLRGAEKVIRNGVAMILCEYSGQAGVLEFLFDHCYCVFDSEYLIVPRREDDEMSGWLIAGKRRLSLGRLAYAAWPKKIPRAQPGYAHFLQAQRRGRVAAQTDLFCIHEGFLEEFWRIQKPLATSD
jgi:FkbM family methyltransferase